MLAAPGIKRRPASRALIPTGHIALNTHLISTNAAKHRSLIPLRPRPNRNRMPRQRLMAILACVIHPAALHLDSNYIQRRVVMRTPRLRIQPHPANLTP